jgi:hypothetical protein
MDNKYRTVRILALLLIAAAIPAAATAARLKPETIEAWDAYVASTEARIEQELTSTQGFLIQDFCMQPDETHELLLKGGVVVAPMETIDGKGNGIPIPDGRIHHWRGSIFLPGVELDEYLYRALNPSENGPHQPEVIEFKILEKKPYELKLFIKMVRRNFVMLAYNTEHHVKYRKHGEGRASSRSEATKIAEIVELGKPHEREKPEGRDRGFMWRLNSYWRFEEADGGLIVEGESMLLSRDIPGILKPVVEPLIRRSAHEMIANTLEEIKVNHVGYKVVKLPENQ